MIIDVNIDVTPHLEALAKAGVTGIIGYLNPHGTTSKVITPARARAIAKAGMTLALVSEGWGDFAHGDISAQAGKRDGLAALASLAKLGAQPGACVYFAVDTDASVNQINGLVIPYFKAIQAAFASSGYRVGVYASGAICEATLGNKSADLAWLAAPTGWLGSREFAKSHKWALHQGLPTHVAGIDCDPNEVNGDYGAFVPFDDTSGGTTGPALRAQEQAASKTVAPQSASIEALAPNVVLSLRERQLDAASGAIRAMLSNGIHNYVANWPTWLQLIIPSEAIGHIAPALARAALDAVALLDTHTNSPPPPNEDKR
jgi:hypothetical protein